MNRFTQIHPVVDHRFNEVMYKYDIQKIYGEYLYLLQEYEIIIDIGILFDSSAVDISFEIENHV